ncbi:MAG TPA: hypothetical protein VJR46_06030 [Candidatus Dormibacteraeota bacterium]|nr:hypothetical protein [Candidatus Dormibacteraeota bacterium]
MNAAGELVLKLALTPLLVGGASLAGRRWGSAVSGWLIGIPFTSGPIAFFLALSPGGRFAEDVAAGIMAGAISQAAFCLGYAWTAQRAGSAGSLAGATLALAASTAVLTAVALPAAAVFVVIIVVIVVALFLMPASRGSADERVEYPAWDIPARMAVATAFVLALTSAAPLLGARPAGLIAPFPLYASVLAAFAHRALGRDAAVGLLRGLLLGLFAFASFFLAVATLLPQGILLAFAAASAAALAVEAGTLVAGRRLGLA